MEHFEPNDAQASISISGTLHIVYLNGRNGPFPVGTLVSSIGTFTVRDSWLEAFEAGEYDGIFEVTELSLYTYRAYGEARTAIRAYIEAYALNDYDTGVNGVDEPEDEVLPDPLDEEKTSQASASSVQQIEVSSSDTAEDIAEGDDGCAGHVELLMSFNGCDPWWKIGDDYTIDSTIGRENMRRCKESLLSLGYSFDPLNQRWTHGGEV